MDETRLAYFLERTACEQYALVEIGSTFSTQPDDAPLYLDIKKQCLPDALFQRCVVNLQDEIYPISRGMARSRLVHSFSELSGMWEIDTSSTRSNHGGTFGLFCNFGRGKTLALVCTLSADNGMADKIGKFHHYGLNILSALRDDLDSDDTSLLTKGERRVLIWCAKGKTSFEISKIVDLSEHTVNHYLNGAVKKLEASNRTHAVAKAIVDGVITPSDLE